MGERDKLGESLRDFYDNQQFKPGDNDWEMAAAHLSKARRLRVQKQVMLAVLALVVLLGLTAIPFYFHSISSQDLATVPAQTAQLPSPAKNNRQNIPVAAGRKQLSGSAGSGNLRAGARVTPGQAKLQETTAVTTTLRLTKTSKQPTTKALGAVQPAKSVFGDQQESAKTTNEIVVSTKSPDDATDDAHNPPSTTLSKAPAADNAVKAAQPFDQDPIRGELLTKDSISVPALTAVDTTSLHLPASRHNNLPGNESPKEVTNVLASDSAAAEPPIDSAMPLITEGIYYEAGIAFLKGWKDADARGFSPIAGIGYMNKVQARAAVSFGVQYLQVNNLSASSKTSRESVYGYGEQSKVTVITPTTLHYLLAPLRFHYYPNPKNCLGAGINLAYLLNVDAKVSTHDEKPGYAGNYSSVKLSGYTQGFSWFDSQLSLFYRRKISRSLALQTELFLGLKDVKQDAFFNLNQKEKNSGLKLTLIYQAFKKNKTK